MMNGYDVPNINLVFINGAYCIAHPHSLLSSKYTIIGYRKNYPLKSKHMDIIEMVINEK